MKPLEVKIKNCGLIKNLETKFPSNGLVLIKGKNKVGKSTFVRALTTMLSAKVPNNMLSVGAKSGFVEQIIRAANGDEYVLRMDLDPSNQTNRFTLINPKGKVSKRISDIKDLFEYNEWVVEDFMDWGKTSDGGRKQAEIVMQLFPKEDQKQIKSLSEDEAEAYKERESIGREMRKKEGAVQNSRPTTDEQQEADMYDELLEEDVALTEELESFKEVDVIEQHVSFLAQNIHSCDEKLNDLRQQYSSNKTEIDRMKAAIVELEQKNKDIAQKAETVKAEKVKHKTSIDEEKKLLEKFNTQRRDEINARLEQIKVNIIESVECRERVKIHNDLKKEYVALKEDYDKEEKRINDIRSAKKNLMTQSLPVSNLVIEEGILYYEDGNNLFKFNANETNTSTLLFKTIEIFLATNKNMDLVLISRGGGDMDRLTLKTLHELGVEKDSLFIMEMVNNDNDIHLEAYEDNGKD